jgi:hypothetical protein
VAKINTNIGSGDKVPVWRCFHCFGVEQQMTETQDWRDTTCKSFANERGLSRRPEETTTNLVNRCKMFLIANGFNFEIGE